jgi:hypothetical protein
MIGLRMNKARTKIGFQYFTSEEYFTNQYLNVWMPTLRQAGATEVYFSSGFDYAIPEDVIKCAIENDLTPSLHFTTELPTPQQANEIFFLFDLYAKWGIASVILGKKPNIKESWQITGWQNENLIDQFLNRLIPLVEYSIKVGLKPVLSPLQPGGNFWDTAFMELVMRGLELRRLKEILEQISLASFGYTYNRPLSWGMGGPERWSISKPYSTPKGDEDQLGFHNFEWIQAIGQKIVGKRLPVVILDAGFPASDDLQQYISSVQKILTALGYKERVDLSQNDQIKIDETIEVCAFSLDSLQEFHKGRMDVTAFEKIFLIKALQANKCSSEPKGKKPIRHYLLLPKHESGVPDVVLNKVKPFIKKFHPTIGFSLEEAQLASKVSIFPDPLLFSTTEINRLRSAGCVVQVLPENGIDIATSLQG